MWPVSVSRADGTVLVEDVSDWEFENFKPAAPVPDLTYLCSQLTEDNRGWTQFAVAEDVDEFSGRPTYRIDLNAAAGAGE